MRDDRLTERLPELDRGEFEAYRVESGCDDVSTRVIRAVEEIVGRDERKDTWLYDSIDPDALDAIFDRKHDGTLREDGKVVFTARGCEIVVHGSGEIDIYAPKDD
ncbi:HalOD1 output domain-containing protein [Haladaptatus sp. NG-WS-4]